ncbi:TPA: hypothetical protein ACJ7CI_000945 [Streptococcus pyogenes]|uniref:hypothetical protein n=1 Tax=Streptococcus pyogenes TaxID=1314 RepID=UPI0010A0EFDA|nr:hypothetical protein [Streptococcus pyogenes]
MYVFIEPNDLKDYLITIYDERNRAIRKQTQVYCFYLMIVLFGALFFFFPCLTIRDLVSYKLPLIFAYLYLIIRSLVAKKMEALGKITTNSQKPPFDTSQVLC